MQDKFRFICEDNFFENGFYLNSVLFSEFKQLVSEETQTEKARRIFKDFDPEGNGFIPTSLLEDIFRSLDIVSEPG